MTMSMSMAVATDIEDKVRRFLRLASGKIRIVQAYLFGSSAKGTRHEWSDIDIAIVSPDFSGDPFEDSKLFFPFILQVDRAIEVHPFRPEAFTEANPFVKEILASGVPVEVVSLE
ncbi:MAG: nucleotidyltransferase domain-containing protein [Calditrichaeota bacterium]|nr:MAG: nucleotidyltransferase domain-containing protein [Calditrichota bacterium]